MIEAVSQSLAQSQAASAYPAQGSEVKLVGQTDKSSQAAEGFRDALARAHEEITTKGTGNDAVRRQRPIRWRAKCPRSCHLPGNRHPAPAKRLRQRQ